MTRPLTIVVGGYIVGFPLGGMTWHHLNYLLGLQELGHEVWFLEDSGSYLLPYNPKTHVCESDSRYGRDYLERTFREYGLPLRYCYYSEFQDKHYGMERGELDALLKRADTLICVSGVTPLRPDRARPRRTLVIDTDPVFTQIRMMHDPAFLAYYREFDAVATFGRLIGTAACPLPTHDLEWIPTCQPVALQSWPVSPLVSQTFTTVGKWEHSSDRHVVFNEQAYRSSKAVEWHKVVDLPHSVPWSMQLGMGGMPAEVRSEFIGHGWSVIDPEVVTRDPRSFADYVRGAAGEFTVTKEIYSGLPSGWFSDRAAVFLASGRPVVSQASGFDQWLPVGDGLFSFHTRDQAVQALHAIAADPARHAIAARHLAERYFDARHVLADLLEQIL